MNLYEDLQWRGLIKDISSPNLIEELNNGKITFYIGTDPTADSLHIGHYSSFLIARRLANAGHIPLLLVGIATGLVGDPRGTEERDISQREVIFRNFEALTKQIKGIFPYEIVNNYDWTKDIPVIEYLRDYGKYINLGYMLGKDLIRRQMETGISYAEFSYMMLQALDFKYLFENRDVTLQVAGSDQWGNITTGIELIRKTTGKEVYGFTMPMVTDAQGRKFGKSEGNAIWIDKNKTSSYELYQYLINSSDDDVIDYLKKLTFLTRDEIEDIEKKHFAEPHLRFAQNELAREIISDLHGNESFENAVKTSKALFSGNIQDLSAEDLLTALKDVSRVEVLSRDIVDVLVEAKVCKSKREARQMVESNAISINGIKINDLEFTLTSENTIDEENIIIRRGKKKYHILTLK